MRDRERDKQLIKTTARFRGLNTPSFHRVLVRKSSFSQTNYYFVTYSNPAFNPLKDLDVLRPTTRITHTGLQDPDGTATFRRCYDRSDCGYICVSHQY